jgi:hypothetical protein
MLCFRIVVFVCYYAVPSMRVCICNICKYLLLEFCILCMVVCLWLLGRFLFKTTMEIFFLKDVIL